MRKRLIYTLLAAGLAFSMSTFSVAADTSSETIAKVQTALNEAGFDCGTADGVAGGKTTESISAYQEANGLTVTGEIDDALLSSLGLATESTVEVPADETEDALTAEEFQTILEQNGYRFSEEDTSSSWNYSLYSGSGSGLYILLHVYDSAEDAAAEFQYLITAIPGDYSSFAVSDTNTSFIYDGHSAAEDSVFYVNNGADTYYAERILVGNTMLQLAGAVEEFSEAASVLEMFGTAYAEKDCTSLLIDVDALAEQETDTEETVSSSGNAPSIEILEVSSAELAEGTELTGEVFNSVLEGYGFEQPDSDESTSYLITPKEEYNLELFDISIICYISANMKVYETTEDASMDFSVFYQEQEDDLDSAGRAGSILISGDVYELMVQIDNTYLEFSVYPDSQDGRNQIFQYLSEMGVTLA